MSVSTLAHCIAVLVFQLWEAQLVTSTCPAPCICEKPYSLNCSSLGLSEIPSRFPAPATDLDLSHNSLRSLEPLWSGRVCVRKLQHMWVGNNSLESLSLCLEGGGKRFRTLTRRKRRCVSWASDLQLLSAERNQLQHLPRGLDGLKSLQILQLSRNRISALGPADLAGCFNLRELYLQHNLIHTIHPQAFKDLQKLQVLDLSFNFLAFVPLPAYRSLRNLNTLVDVSHNRWKCDCNLKIMKRWLNFDSELSNPSWNVMCFSPPHHSGKELIRLNDSDLICPQDILNTAGIDTEVAVDEGEDLLLPCSKFNRDVGDSLWWTPQGQISGRQHFFFISNITTQHAGLYICVSGLHKKSVSVFNVHVHQKSSNLRLRREIQRPRDEFGAERTNTQAAVRQVTQSQFALAVSLSVIITFIVAFVLGVILRPFMDKLYKTIRNKRRTATSQSGSTGTSTPQRPYVNEGYSDTDDQEQDVQMGTRVTFGGVTEVQYERDVQYYVTVEDPNADCSSRSELKVDELKTQAANCEEVSLKKGNELPREFEHIPDQEDLAKEEERSISSASSCSDEQNHQSFKTKDFIVQNITPPTVRVQEADPMEFTSDPFSEMPEFRAENLDELDPELWNDSGDSFSFTEGSPRLNSPVLQLETETSVHKESDGQSYSRSSESEESECEGREHMRNQEDDDGKLTPFKDIAAEDQNPDIGDLSRQDTITLDPSDIHIAFTHGDSFDERQFSELNESSDSSNTSSDYDDEPLHYRVHPVYRTGQYDESKTSSSSEAEEEDTAYCPRRLEIKTEHHENIAHPIPVQNPKKVLNLEFDKSSSSTDKEESTSRSRQKGILKRLSGLLLHKEEDQAPSPNTDRGKVTSSLRVSPERHPEPPVENVDPTTELTEQVVFSLPKLKQSVSFTPSDPQPPIPQSSTPSVKNFQSTDSGDVGTSSEDRYAVKFDEIQPSVPQIKRYLHFSPTHATTSQHLIQSLSPITNDENILNVWGDGERRKGSCFSEDDMEPCPTINGVFAQTGLYLNKLPEVKRHLQFSFTETNQPELVSKTESRTLKESLDSLSDEDIYNDGMDVSLNSIPRVQSYIYFKPIETKPPVQSQLLPLKPQRVMLEVESTPSSVQELGPPTEDRLSGDAGSPLEGLPKLKRYLQFRQHSTHDATISKETQKPDLRSDDYQFPNTDDNLSKQKVLLDQLPKMRYLHFKRRLEEMPVLTSKAEKRSPVYTDDDVRQTPNEASLDLPKVKRYIQFTQSSTHSPAISREPIIDAEIKTKPDLRPDDQFLKTEDKIILYDKLPTITRYIHFNHHGPEATIQKVAIPVFTPQVGKPYPLQTGDEVRQTTEESSGQIEVSLDLLKVKRYIQFTQQKPYSRTLSGSHIVKTQLTTQLDQMKGHYSEEYKPNEEVSLEVIPKIQRYVQFTAHSPKESHRAEVKPHIAPAHIHSETQAMHPILFKPTLTEYSLSGQTEWSLSFLPKLKRYIQFESNEPFLKNTKSLQKQTVSHEVILKPPLQRPRPSSASRTGKVVDKTCVVIDSIPKMKRSIHFSIENIKRQPIRSMISSENTLWPVTNRETFSKDVGDAVDRMPQLKRYLKFTQPQATSSSPMTPIKTEIIPAAESWKTGSLHEKDPRQILRKDVYNSLDVVPKIRYIQFENSEPEITSSTVTTTQSGRSDPSSEEELSAFRQDRSLDGIPKVMRYIQLTTSEPCTRSLLRPQLNTDAGRNHSNAEIQMNNPSSEDYSEVAADEHRLINQSGVFLEGLPKVSGYIQFTERSTQPINTSLHKQTDTQERQNSQKPDLCSPANENTSISGIPKVQRHLMFSESQSNLSNPSTDQKVKSDPQSNAEFKRSMTEDSFSGQTEPYLTLLPRVNRHIQFTQPECYTSSHSQRSISKPTELKTGSDRSFEGKLFLENIPKVKRYQQFTALSLHTDEPERNLEAPLQDSSIVPQMKQHIHFTPLETTEVSTEQMFSTHSSNPSFRNLSSHKINQFSTSETDSIHNFALLTSPRKYPVTNSGLRNVSYSISETPPEKDEAREYLRDSALARQRHERRRQLFHDKKKAMHHFSLTSTSFEDDEPVNVSVSQEVNPASSQHNQNTRDSPGTSATLRRMDVQDSEFENPSSKTITQNQVQSTAWNRTAQ